MLLRGRWIKSDLWLIPLVQYDVSHMLTTISTLDEWNHIHHTALHHITSHHHTALHHFTLRWQSSYLPFRFRLVASSISIENSRFNCLTCSVPTLSSLLEKTLSTPSLPPLTKSSDPGRGYTVQTQLGCMIDCTVSEPAHTITPPSSPHVTIVTPTNDDDDDDDDDDGGDEGDDEGESCQQMYNAMQCHPRI